MLTSTPIRHTYTTPTTVLLQTVIIFYGLSGPRAPPFSRASPPDLLLDYVYELTPPTTVTSIILYFGDFVKKNRTKCKKINKIENKA